MTSFIFKNGKKSLNHGNESLVISGVRDSVVEGVSDLCAPTDLNHHCSGHQQLAVEGLDPGGGESKCFLLPQLNICKLQKRNMSLSEP